MKVYLHKKPLYLVVKEGYYTLYSISNNLLFNGDIKISVIPKSAYYLFFWSLIDVCWDTSIINRSFHWIPKSKKPYLLFEIGYAKT